jgi:hypothetical protein
MPGQSAAKCDCAARAGDSRNGHLRCPLMAALGVQEPRIGQTTPKCASSARVRCAPDNYHVDEDLAIIGFCSLVFVPGHAGFGVESTSVDRKSERTTPRHGCCGTQRLSDERYSPARQHGELHQYRYYGWAERLTSARQSRFSWSFASMFIDFDKCSIKHEQI